MGNQGKIRIPEAVFDEIGRGKDSLSRWLSSRRNIFLIPTNDALSRIQQVMNAYGSMTDIQLEQLNGKADPYLVAHALVIGATVVTNELSSPGTTSPLNKKIPDICSCLDVSCIRYPRFLWEMRPYAPQL